MHLIKTSRLIRVWALVAFSYSVLALHVKEGDGSSEFEAISNSADMKTSVILRRQKRAMKMDTSKAGVTATEREAFIKAHNEWRSKVAPTAANMEFMTWDWDVAAKAQEWANGCNWAHGGLEPAGTSFQHLGQNLYMHSSGYDEAGAVSAWGEENVDYTFTTRACVEGKMCGHYTQVVWGTSNKVGCGIKYCGSLTGLSGGGYLVVCDYGPAGNWKGEHPFTEGTPCSACPQSKPTCENKLCRESPKCGGKVCENEGVLKEETCECVCPEISNWSGPTCNLKSEGTRGAATSLVTLASIMVAIWSTCLE